MPESRRAVLTAPVVSVVVCTRNRRAWLAEAVDSVRQQRGLAWELIIVDDASTDETWTYLQSLATKHELAVRIFRQTQHGERSAARNRGAGRGPRRLRHVPR